MGKLFLSLVVAAGMAAGVAKGLAAQDRATNARERLEELAAKLNLTDDQKARIQPVLEEQAPKMKAIRDDSTLDRRGKMQKAMEVRSETDRKIRPILTKEQQELLDAKRENTRSQMRSHGKRRRRG